MKPCHAAALVLVGWYLMIPPLSHDDNSQTNLPMAAAPSF